ncbi:MAG: AAA family ATPase [Thermomicrobiales bacterium]|nr:AAA family ATPase [Thermomicrobiales bacterium]MCO5229336.1 AAA family ATPase [Thermomicrobiales bacterium]
MTQRAIIITGPVGAGKTTTTWALAELLEQNDISCAAIDMDSLRWFHPTPPDDPFGSAVGFRHLRMMTQTFRETSIPTLVLADVIEETTADHQRAMPGYDVIVVRLQVDFARLDARLRQRETEIQIPWHLNRARELQGIMERNGIGDVVIEVKDESPAEIALSIATRLGLIS